MSRLLTLREKTGCNVVQKTGQRRFGPPPAWTGPPPPRGCEIFIGKLPRHIFEDELVPIFSKVGKIYEMRLMMDYSGSNRGFAFVTYTSRDDAAAAVDELDGLEIRPGRHIGVAKSVDNCRLFLGDIPQNKTEKDVFVEISKVVPGVVDVTLDKDCFDRRRSRGFAFVKFVSHHAAALARRALAPAGLWGRRVAVDWAQPEPHIDHDLMKQVKVHRSQEVSSSMDFTQTLMLYKQHLEEREFEEAWENVELGSEGAAALHCEQQTDTQSSVMDRHYSVAPAKLAAICKVYGWSVPVYNYRQFIDHSGNHLWIGHVALPYVGLPLLTMPCPVGPLETQACSSTTQAQVEAAKMMLNCIKQSEWSVEWSTSTVPGMDNATGSARARRQRGRRRLRLAALALASCLTMHCRVVEPAITTGLLYYPFLIAAVAGLANPLRHFEVYLGQWSINGPGRAFRVLPMLDGIGIAMCISSLVRAINCCAMAAIALLYVVYSSSDSRLPSTYCSERSQTVRQCNEVYHGYPVVYSAPAYNYFYVELVRLRPTYDFSTFNVPLLICLACIWVSIWLLMIAERITFGRLVWNSLYSWIAYVPWIWVACLAAVAFPTVSAPTRIIKQLFRLGDRDIFMGLTDAFVVALYIHSASMGTELVHGKGLNFYALGHIDPLLNHDNVWHSCLVLALAVLHSIFTTVCALGDVAGSDLAGYYNTRESFMWVMPMYSKCTSQGNYSHAMSCIIFGGLSFSYIVVAYPLIKSSLHTIFEYKVKLVFVEQQIVAALICSCMLLSLPYATAGGLALLESVESMMTGLAMPLVVLAELVAMLYVYRSPDFQSDINIATEDNACNTRISTSWHIIPLITVVVLIGKIIAVSNAEMPAWAMCAAVAPLLAAVLALPLRAAHNAVAFMHPAPRRGV